MIPHDLVVGRKDSNLAHRGKGPVHHRQCFDPAGSATSWTWRDSNPHRPACKAGACPVRPQAHRSGGGIRTSNPLLNWEPPCRLGFTGMSAVGRSRTPILGFEARDVFPYTTTAWHRAEESNLVRPIDTGFTDRLASETGPGRWQLDLGLEPGSGG